MILNKQQFLEFVCGKQESLKYDVEFKKFNKNSFKALIKLKFYNDIFNDNTIAIFTLNDYYCVLEWQKGINLNKSFDMSEDYRKYVISQLLKKDNADILIDKYLFKCKSNLIHERKERYFG